MKCRIVIFVLIMASNILIGQQISGIVRNARNNQPIEFVNMGIVGKNVGTVTNLQGEFSFLVDSTYNNDTLLFSVIGYHSVLIEIGTLRKNATHKVILEEKDYALAEVVVKPKIFKERTLGVTTKFKKISAGFKDNLLGYELGIRMKVKKTAYIKKVDINISYCSYDTIFYRLNIYKVHGKKDFENILKEPIYIKMPKELVKDKIQIDLESKNIVVEGDFLITLEHIKELGEGYLYFCAGLTDKTYYRKTSQGKWESAPVGISISVIADVEK